jgi:hypothetical protein
VGVNTSALGAKRILGLLLIAMGLLLIFVLIDIAPYGLVAGLVFAWVVTILISAGSFLLLNVRVRNYLPSLLAVSMALILWSLIFLVQLPSNLQILLAPVVGLVSILLWRFFKAGKSWSHHF